MTNEDTLCEMEVARETAENMSRLAAERTAWLNEYSRSLSADPRWISEQARRARLRILVRRLGDRIVRRLTAANSDIIFVSGAIETLAQSQGRFSHDMWSSSALAYFCGPDWGKGTRSAQLLFDDLIHMFMTHPHPNSDALIKTATGLTPDEIDAQIERAMGDMA